MNRRGFLKGILAAGSAPFVVTTAGVLMPVRERVWTPQAEPFRITWDEGLGPDQTAVIVVSALDRSGREILRREVSAHAAGRVELGALPIGSNISAFIATRTFTSAVDARLHLSRSRA